jgi:hypothetical protein
MFSPLWNDNLLSKLQPGIPRTKERVLDELQKQVKLACSGVSQHVKDAQTQTGVKDAYTQYWIDDLIARFKNIKKDNPNRSSDEIQVELIQWTVENHEKIYSPFLTMKGCVYSAHGWFLY